ncbi:glutamyl-tRNA reductase [Roseimaritima ulvae]|uniref:Glutamyl-tRNA reductase n=1 Tax=Roseimaritima ulvae TaxID=980254 RepID=A0A5B9R0R6_9BACT|nr:glutamyl-tRNA reductase [Roseimaritima ulvae]QEG43859.1 Glutamyl-tRNA reductase [Roseimaritima ulvae]
MKLKMIGCNHRQAAVEFREQLSFTAEQAREALAAFRNRFPAAEVVLLSTCNRIELYTGAADGPIPDDQDVAGFLAHQRSLPADGLLDHLVHLDGPEAIEHLFTVAASLDSMVIGEAQIISQVKQAYELACDSGSTGPLTHAAFQAANHVAKRVDRETSIHRRRVSVPSVAVGEVVPEFFDTLSDKSIVLIGAGEMGEETLRYLIDAGAKRIHVVNRSLDRAQEIVGRLAGTAHPWSDLDALLTKADLVVSTTGATDTLIGYDNFLKIHEARYERLLLILDLAVPRDFEHSIGDLAGVYLYSVDDLQSACDHNQQQRQREWPKAKSIIEEETRKFVAEIHHRATGPVIRRLREQAEQLKQEELKRLMGRLQHKEEESAAMQREIQQSFDRLVNKLLHPPLASLKDDAAAGHRGGLLVALRELFKLHDHE